jgi:hypothetical protein
MGEEIELAAKTSAEVVTALTEASGALGPPQEFWGAITSGIHYRFYPRVIKQAQVAAEKIRESSLPERAYSEIPDKLLRAILEQGAVEDNPDMQVRWANLLANALTSDSADVRIAFPKILDELEPIEATFLESLVEVSPVKPISGVVGFAFGPGDQGLQLENLENLVRLGLLEWSERRIADESPQSVALTGLGSNLLSACRAPQPASSDITEA